MKIRSVPSSKLCLGSMETVDLVKSFNDSDLVKSSTPTPATPGKRANGAGLGIGASGAGFRNWVRKWWYGKWWHNLNDLRRVFGQPVVVELMVGGHFPDLDSDLGRAWLVAIADAAVLLFRLF
jgi:hypothetical protein